MWFFLWGIAAWAGASAEVVWHESEARFQLTVEAGETIAGDAPATIKLEWNGRKMQMDTTGQTLSEGVSLGDVRGAWIQGEAECAVCDKQSGKCEVLKWDFQGQVSSALEGTLILEPKEARGFRPPGSSADVLTERLTDALTQATASHHGVLLDFGAVWCPPCNLLAAELLHKRPAPDVLSSYEVVEVDVDDFGSWAVKDRYNVGSYPTMVIVDGAGVEQSRMVGYPGREKTIAWLQDNADAFKAVGSKSGIEDVDPEQAAEIAWDRAQRGEKDVADWLARAQGASESLSYRLAKMRVEPTLEDVRWLADRPETRALDWVPWAMDVPKVKAKWLVPAIRADLSKASGFDLVDLLYSLANLSKEDDAVLHFATAAAVLSQQLTGDGTLDRGHYSWLAYLYEHANQLEEALVILDKSIDTFPEDPTFYLSKARMLLRNDRQTQALEVSTVGLTYSWGDNRLRLADAHAEALYALDRSDEAVVFLEGVLGAKTAPEEGLNVRTHRYRTALLKRLESAR